MNQWTQQRAGVRLCVKVEAPARLHLGFLDLHGGLGRRFGGFGLAIAEIATRLSVTKATAFSARGPESERALELARSLCARLRLPHAVAIRLFEAIPTHVGLGSGTQLALAVGTAIARLYELDLSTREIGMMLSRGARSGVGVGAFDMGGFVVDGGRGPNEQLPPVTARLAFPADWRIVLVHDCSGKGLHGAQEVSAFDALPAFPSERAAHLCRLVLMQILPAIADAQLAEASDGINELQTVVGDYFAPAQGGRFASEAVAAVLAWFERRGVTGVGQSSWGPTGFALIGSEAQAHALIAQAQSIFDTSAARLQLVRARNYGGLVEHYPQAQAMSDTSL